MSYPTGLAQRIHEAASYSYVPGATSNLAPELPAPQPPPPPPSRPEPAPEPEPEPAPDPTYRANAGVPGDFTGGPVPVNLAILTASNVSPWPPEAWGEGESIILGDGSEYTWDGSAWQLVGDLL